MKKTTWKSILATILLSGILFSVTAGEKPKVLIIGDSISLGYTPFVIEELKDVAEVEHNQDPPNAAASRGGVRKIDGWLAKKDYDIIHFNWGLWDINRRVNGKRNNKGPISISEDKWKANMTKLVKRMKQTKAILIFGNITYVPGGWGRVKGDEITYNKIAEEIMKENGVEINDLHSYSEELFKKGLYLPKGNVHLSKEGYKELAKPVAEKIKEVMKKLPKK